MPVLKSIAEELKQLELPSSKDATDPQDKAWVVMDISPLLTGDVTNVDATARNTGEGMMYMVAGRIREWNFTEADGTPIPINFDALKRMEPKDFAFLQEQFKDGEGALTDDEKKASSFTSSPKGTGIVITDGNQTPASL